MGILSKKRLTLFSLLMVMLSSCFYIKNGKNGAEVITLSTQVKHFLKDVEYISKLPRISGEPHHKEVQLMCATRFKQLGFQVELHDYGTGTNVIGVYPGIQAPAEKIVVSAHYDTVPNCNGADDNASGIAGVFETARLLASKKHNRTLIVACWDEEERKTVGSKAYVVREKNKGADIKMSYVYEMIGFKTRDSNTQKIPQGFELIYPQQVEHIQNNQSRGDFIALIYDDRATHLLSGVANHAKKNHLPVMQFEVSSNMKGSPAISDLRRSDHSAFWDVDYPAIMITDTANFRNQHYHCIKGDDNVESLDINFALQIVNTFTEIVEENLK